MKLPTATSETNLMIGYALPLVDSLFEPGLKYLKAGVILGDLVPDGSIQESLFGEARKNSGKELMQAIDNINFSQRGDMVKYVASGLSRGWTMKQELRSKRFTSRWDELFEIR
jgi:DNA polymerase V